MIEELLTRYAEFQAFCQKQQAEARKMQNKLNKQYEKDRKKLPDFIRFRADYSPPIFDSIYDDPTFEVFMDWLAKVSQTHPEETIKK